jgi:ArsR family transcriptional regulator, arsenate/arsenite/antimonite-responsive transcriptional repressor
LVSTILDNRTVPSHISHARAVRALDALAHDTRLKVHRLLVQAGEDGLSAGFIARRLGLPPSSLSFHLMHLQVADLVTQRRAGRSLIYTVNFAVMDGLMGYLQENCCRGFPSDDCDTDECASEERKLERTNT